MKNKIFLSFLVFILLFTTFCFSTSAYNVTLRDVLLPSSDSTLFVSRRGDGISYSCDYEWLTNGTGIFVYYVSGANRNDNFSLSCSTHASGGIPVKSGDVISFTGKLFFSFPAVTSHVNDLSLYNMFISCGFLDVNSKPRSVSVPFTLKKSAGDEFGVYYDFNLFYEIPANFVKYTDLVLAFSYPPVTFGYNIVVEQASELNFYLGDRSSAPLYSSPDTSALEEYENVEDSIISSTDEGFNTFSSLIDNIKTFISGSSSSINGARAIALCANQFINIPLVNSIFNFSLVLGLAFFLLGVGSTIVRSVSSSRSHDWKNNKQGKAVNMLDFFGFVVDCITKIIDYLVQSVKALFTLLLMIPQIVSLPMTLSRIVPNIVLTSGIVMFAVASIKLIVGRDNS